MKRAPADDHNNVVDGLDLDLAPDPARSRRNPFRVAHDKRVGLAREPSPRVAEYGNAGLEDSTPFGVANDKRIDVARDRSPKLAVRQPGPRAQPPRG